MPPHVIDLRKTEDWRDAVHRAGQALVEGRIVAFPTETVYGLAADARNEEAVQRLIEAKGRPEGHPFALAIKGPEEALDYIPDLSPLAARLARRCWPGPVTLVLDARHPESLAGQFPETVRKWLMPSGTLGLRVPAHPMINDVLRMLHGPVVLTSANRSGGSDATTAQQVVESLDGEVHLVLDDGGSRYGQPSSVIRVNGSKLEVLREGVVSSATLTRLSSFVLLFVCTGNTCRSPMAEAIARQVIAEQKGCDPKQLEDHGVIVLSAGDGRRRALARDGRDHERVRPRRHRSSGPARKRTTNQPRGRDLHAHPIASRSAACTVPECRRESADTLCG